MDNMDNKNNIKELKKKLLEKEKTINYYENKINKLNNELEKYKTEDFIKWRNHQIFKETMKYLEICINYFNKEIKQYSIYGDFFESLLTNSPLYNKTIYFYVKNRNLIFLDGLCEIFRTLELVTNKYDYNLLKIKIFNEEEHYFYSLKLLINDEKINFIFHDKNYLENINSSGQNFEINESGICNIINNSNYNNIKINSLNIFNNLYNLVNKKIEIYNDQENKILIENPEILDFIDLQNYYKNKNIKVLNKIKTKNTECSICFEKDDCLMIKCKHLFCNECIKSHISNNNYNNKTCPLCRSDMKLI